MVTDARRPGTSRSFAALVGFLVLGVAAVWGSPTLDHALNPKATQPGLVSFLGVGLAVLALTALILFLGLRRLLPRTGIFLAAAFGYNALLVAVKLGLGPIGIDIQNAYYKEHALTPGALGYSPGFTFLTDAFPYPGLAAITAILYGLAFMVIYMIFQTRLQRRLGVTVALERRFVTLLVIMFVLAAVGGLTLIGLLGFLEYALSLAFASLVAILIAVALLGAVVLCSVAFNEATEQAALARNVALLSTFAWVGLAFIAAYHILWLVFLLTLISIWPLKSFTFTAGVK